MLEQYFKNLYQRTMSEAYGLAIGTISKSVEKGGNVLDCGANNGNRFDSLVEKVNLDKNRYYGIEWDKGLVKEAAEKGLNVIQGDLNKGLPYQDKEFKCVFALSLLEHLINPCRYLNECYRVLQDNGLLVILTPNISTYFTAFLILLGRMPSSGPHPDSNVLLKKEEIFKVSSEDLHPDTERDTPIHRHFIVFSYRVLRDYLNSVGFSTVEGHGFGVYPFPNFLQPILEKIDPYHCHQMVFIAKK
jgi:methionine biosynthesis protein MetW